MHAPSTYQHHHQQRAGVLKALNHAQAEVGAGGHGEIRTTRNAKDATAAMMIFAEI